MSDRDDQKPDPPPDPRTRTTLELDPLDIHSWPIVLAGLERLGEQLDWEPVLALRLGTLGLIQGVIDQMRDRNASADLVDQLRQLVEALARMPWAIPEPKR